ncbi:hypothetical protein SAY86_007484 [Trapa natans]|uniref:Uncharacterized protein n=1 Tax=Trapa natans TaxID=22666 RepID=A0AAN7R0F3_TRANT|nr:hypothetical protein SAY86_007484 [Trapa natans]
MKVGCKVAYYLGMEEMIRREQQIEEKEKSYSYDLRWSCLSKSSSLLSENLNPDRSAADSLFPPYPRKKPTAVGDDHEDGRLKKKKKKSMQEKLFPFAQFIIIFMLVLLF